MSRLREKTVQRKALEELKTYYSNRERNNDIFPYEEVRTKKEKGDKRADGLLCFKTGNNPFYTVSMEAKSHRTLGALASSVSDHKLGKHSIWAALAATALTVICLGIFLDMMWYYLVLSGGLVFLAFTLLSIWVFDWLDLDHHKVSSVVEQLKQYPANEQWVVYSKDAYNLLATVPAQGKKSHQQVLDSLCKQNGFGLMLISRQNSEFVIYPQVKNGSFLSCYSRDQKIMADLVRKGSNLNADSVASPLSSTSL